MSTAPATTADSEARLKAALRLLAVKKAESSLLDFQRFRMPDPDDPENPEASLYQVTPQAKLLCEVLEKVERGELLRVCVSIGPQLGKSEIISRGFPAWFAGRNPHKHFMLGTYNQDFAEDFGGEIREIMGTAEYRQVFPKFSLRKGSKAKDAMITSRGGRLNFIGRGGAGSGKPADMMVIDDPIKDDKEAQSPTLREDTWAWFNKVMLARCHKFTAIVIVHTRWHEDDLIGRLCDPTHPDHDPEVAGEWTYINIPAVVKDHKLAEALGLTLEAPTNPSVIQQFGNAPMAALWPERKPLEFLASARRLDKRGFEALYMGSPSPDDGDYFRRDDLIGYKPHELPKNLRKYAASDHALTTKQENDANCLGCVGVDEDGVIWVLPDIDWERMEPDETVERMIAQMRRHKPMVWWAENEHINKAIGPFLRKRMREEGVYTPIDPQTPSKDKKARATSIRGRMQMHMVRFPTFAPWWAEAEAELLKFPNAKHDDFVDWLSWIGLGLDKELPASKTRPKEDNVIRTGTLRWVKSRIEADRRRAALVKARNGM